MNVTQTHWPTPTGEPMQQHQALRLADELAWWVNNTDAQPDVCMTKSAAELRRLHALVVQMREALEESVDFVRSDFALDWRQGIPSRAKQLEGMRQIVANHEDALTAANDYLGKT